MATADKLTHLSDTKVAINAAIVAKGVPVPAGTTFRSYADKIALIEGGGEPTPTPVSWSRPTDWLDMPVLLENEVNLLYAVFDTDSEFFTVDINSGGYNYEVDWGDGNSESFTSASTNTHKYDYNNANLDSSTLIKHGYKQCIITIKRSAVGIANGANLSLIDFVQTGTPNIGYGKSANILDLHMDIPTGQLVTLGRNNNVEFHLLENINIIQYGIYSMYAKFQELHNLKKVTMSCDIRGDSHYMFKDCYALIEVELLNITGTNTSLMFVNCNALNSVVIGNITNCTNTQEMFSYCYTLQSLIIGDTSNVTNMSNMFAYCDSITEIPLFNTSNVTNMYNMFAYCNSITEIPLLNTSNVTNMSNMFAYCKSLSYIPNINTSKVTDMYNMFSGCVSLTEVPTFDYSTVTTMNNMFENSGLHNIGDIYAPLLTQSRYIFSKCKSLYKIGDFNAPLNLNLYGAFQYCEQFQISGTITAGDNCNVANLVYNMDSLKKFKWNSDTTLSLSSQKMSSIELDELYTSLQTVTAQTLTVSGNYGVGSDDQSIATAKGWTVTS